MIGTHAPKLFNSRIQQAAICADIQGEIPKQYICSKNLTQGKKYWALPNSAAYMRIFKEQIEALKGKPEDVLPDNIAPEIKQLLLPYQNDYVSVSPVPSCMVLSEVWKRLKEKETTYKHWTIQPTQAAMATHGQILSEQYGRVRMFIRGTKKVDARLAEKDSFVQLEAEIQDLNIASGMVAQGFPAITAIGGLVHMLERETNQKIQFAIGFKKIQHHEGVKKFSRYKSGNITPALITEEITGNARIVLLLKGYNLEDIAKALKGIRRFASGRIVDETISIQHNTQPSAASFLNDASDDLVIATDALDAAIDVYKGKDSMHTIIHAGYAFLEEPTLRTDSRQGKHTWAEPLFASVCLSPFSKQSWWSRYEEDKFVVWAKE